VAIGEPEVLWRPDPDRHLSVLFDVFALGRQVRSLVAAAMAGCGLRPDEYAAYSVVFEARTVTMTELARELGMPVTTAADYVRSMRERGHLRRTRHPTDSRAYLLSLTAAGLRAHRKASAAFAIAHEAFVGGLSGLTPDQARDTLGRLTAAARVASTSMAAAPRKAAGRAAPPGPR
jgi:DNA-binding MarR family transcriptional regulator